MKRTESYNTLLNFKKLKALLSFGVKGYLTQIGWFKAFETHSPVDGNGEAIPWVTYSFIDFISDRINKEHLIFEFGSGNSTLFYARRAKKVISVEHDKEWFEKINASKPSNSEMIFCELKVNGEYCKTPSTTGLKFDIVIVDGRDRVNCCYNSLSVLTDQGIIVLDDSHRERYGESRTFFLSQGFKELPFTGISPGLFYNKSTSIFYKANNCVGI